MTEIRLGIVELAGRNLGRARMLINQERTLITIRAALGEAAFLDARSLGRRQPLDAVLAEATEREFAEAA